jgi:hypothetical protein
MDYAKPALIDVTAITKRRFRRQRSAGGRGLGAEAAAWR